VNKWGLGRCFEFTVTTPDNCKDVKEFQRRWHSLYTNVVRRLFAGGCGTRERQERGAWHVHCVVVMPFEVTAFPWNEVRNGCYKHVDRRLLVLWRYLRRAMKRYGFGRFRLVPIWSSGKAAARYFAKYVTKAFASRDPEDIGTRRWFTWGDARRAKCSFAFIGSHSRHKIGWMAKVLGFQWYDDFKENLGPRWAYYLFPLLDRDDWNEARDAVWVTACLLRDGFWKHARWLSSLISSGASLGEALAVRPDMEPVVVAYLETGALSPSTSIHNSASRSDVVR